MATLDIKTEISGSVWKLEKKPGDPVAAEETILILESMKMEIPVCAPRAGVITALFVAEEELINEGAVVAQIEY